MRDGGRIAAAIEVLADMEARHRPVADALKDWGLSHRFAGSGDRTVIGNLAHDALRHRSSHAHRMGEASPRAAVLATYALTWGRGLSGLEPAMAEPHAPEPLTEDEFRRLGTAYEVPEAPDWVQGDLPEAFAPHFARVFGDRIAAEGAALATRAPVDLRVNTLKGDRDKAFRQLSHLAPDPTPLSPLGLRLAVGGVTARTPNVESEPAFQRGLIEIQDEGSQLAALVAGAGGPEQGLDFCAGAGGKTLALAAEKENRGQIHAFDADKRRMRDIFDRVKRAGAHNVQIHTPGRNDGLVELQERMDFVLVDAPCTGTGTWRRRPDAKWRVTLEALERRIAEQDAVLDDAIAYVRPGGRLVYVTCSVLAEENEERIAAFLARHPGWTWADPLARLDKADKDVASRLRPFVRTDLGGPALRVSPASAGTDGFFVAVVEAPKG